MSRTEQRDLLYFGNQGNPVYYCGRLPVSGRMRSQAAVRMGREATESETGGGFCSFCGTVFKITPSGTLSCLQLQSHISISLRTT